MKSKILGLSLILTFLAAAGCLAADPFMGTWKLNEKKSKLAKGTGKNDTVVYSSGMWGKTKVTVDGTDAMGKPAHSEWSGKFDGKDYKVTGDPQSDMRAYTKVNDHTLNMTSKKGGKPAMSGSIMVSKDGRTRTVNMTGTNAKGTKFKTMAVYDKQ